MREPTTGRLYLGGMEEAYGWLKDLIRDIPDFPRPGVVFKDLTPLLSDAAGLAACVDGLAEAFHALSACGLHTFLNAFRRGKHPG